MSWPPGDKRGHWSPLFDFYGRLRSAGHRLNVADEITRSVARAKASGDPVSLNESQRRLVAGVIGGVIRGGPEVGIAAGQPAAEWIALAAAIEPEHVHLLVAANDEPISRLVGRVKGKSSSLIGHGSGQRVWTTGFWRAYLFDRHAIDCVRDYIAQHNIRRGLPADPFDWLTPPRPI